MSHRSDHAGPRRPRRGPASTSAVAAALAFALVAAACSDGGTGPEAAGTSSAAASTTSIRVEAGENGGFATLDDLLDPTRQVKSAHFELRRHLGMPGERIVEIIEGDFDRTTNAVAFVQRFEASELFRAQLAAASPGAGPIEDFRLHTIRVGGFVYVGPSTAGVPPSTWIRYDEAAFEKATPGLEVDFSDGPLVPLLDDIEHRDGSTVRRGRRLVFDAGPRTTFEAAVAPSSAVYELGNRFIRTTSVVDFVDELDADVPLSVELDDDNVLHTLSLEATALYRDVAERSGISAVRQAAQQITSVRSDLRLTAHGRPVTIAPPDPATVQTA